MIEPSHNGRTRLLEIWVFALIVVAAVATVWALVALVSLRMS